MATKPGSTFSSVFFLQLALGVFFVTLGISGLTDYNSSLSEFKRFFGKNDTLSVAMAVVELVMGAILVLGLFMSVSAGMTKLLGLALFALWAAYIVLNFFAQGFLKPGALEWFCRLSWHAVILVSLWIVGRRYM